MVFLNTKIALDRPFCICSKSVGITCLRHFCHFMFSYNVTIFALKLLLLLTYFPFCHYDTIFSNKSLIYIIIYEYTTNYWSYGVFIRIQKRCRQD